MTLRTDFIAQAKRDNWFFSMKTTSLGPLIQTLGVNVPNPVAIAKEFARLPDAKRRRYQRSLALLEARLPPLQKLVATHQGGIGLTDQSYMPGKPVRRKDSDGRWYDFEMQEKGNSCGPTCVRIVLKEFTHIALPSEREVRDGMSLYESGVAHQGITKSNHDWENIGSNVPSLVRYLANEGLRDARSVHGPSSVVLAALKKCSKNYPGIIGWWWGLRGDSSNGGHWTVCVGPSKAGDKLVILDPWNGVQYLDVATYTDYNVNGAHGWFDPDDASDQAVVVTFPKGG
jgi:hypothetical protein